MPMVLFHPSLLGYTNIYEMSPNVPSQRLVPLLLRLAEPRMPLIVQMMLVRDFIPALPTQAQG
jgi:hypothetical protein